MVAQVSGALAPPIFSLKYFSSGLKISNRLEQRETKPLRDWFRQKTGYHHLDWSSLIKSAYSQNEANTITLLRLLLSTFQHCQQQYFHLQKAQMKHSLNKNTCNLFYFLSDIPGKIKKKTQTVLQIHVAELTNPHRKKKICAKFLFDKKNKKKLFYT